MTRNRNRTKGAALLAALFVIATPAFAQGRPANDITPRASDPATAIIGTWNALMVGRTADPSAREGLATDAYPTRFIFTRSTMQILTLVNGRTNAGAACPYTLSAVDRVRRTASITVRCRGGAAMKMEPSTLIFTPDYRAVEFVSPGPKPAPRPNVADLTTVLAFIGVGR